MVRIDDGRWDSNFGKFVSNYGVTPLAEQLAIQPAAVYHWIRSATSPRPAIAADICELARARGIDLSLEDVYGHARKPRDRKTLGSDSCRSRRGATVRNGN